MPFVSSLIIGKTVSGDYFFISVTPDNKQKKRLLKDKRRLFDGCQLNTAVTL